MARKSRHPIALALLAMLCAPAGAPARAQAPAAGEGVCFPTSETREEIKAHHLVEPFVALKSAAATVQGRGACPPNSAGSATNLSMKSPCCIATAGWFMSS